MAKVTQPLLLASSIAPSSLEQWFPMERQAHYIQQIRKQVDITRRQAECFIRLWAYLMLKQQQARLDSSPGVPVNQLAVVPGEVPCSHREAADLFYANSDRGSDRAAGMMLDELVKRKLITRTFDGNSSTIHIHPIANIDHGLTNSKTEELVLQPDEFNPRLDAVFAAQLLSRYYGWVALDASTMASKFNQALRQWTKGYAKGLRVLRCALLKKIVGVYSLFPAAIQSNVYFFSPPSQGLYLINEQSADALVMAQPGDEGCTVVYIRGWAIDSPYLNRASVQQSLEDMQKVLREMLQDFPNLCDLYGLSIHPGAEAIARSLGFQKTVQDSSLPVAWLYIPLDQFLEVDIAGAIAPLEYLSS